MENANPPPTKNHPVLPVALRPRINKDLHELHAISAFVDSHLKTVDTPLVSPFPHSDNDSDGEEVLNELSFRKFTAYLDPFLPMNIISRKAYNTIMVDGLEGTKRNLVAIVRDVYVCRLYLMRRSLEDLRMFSLDDSWRMI
ncbi:hypothetical protein Tco_1068394 [Tanacetum coccineum]|uniref:Uncharacterized protein n=1 Tax=Tanacetum coccineum TaxID=301880 RepID=A0ABQ5HHI6_9ASTR